MEGVSTDLFQRAFHVTLEKGAEEEPLLLPSGHSPHMDLRQAIQLRHHCGRRWLVTLKRTTSGRYMFARGWLRFAKQAALRGGMCLIFIPVSSTIFDVKIYDLDACQCDVVRVPWKNHGPFLRKASFCRYLRVNWGVRLKIPSAFASTYAHLLQRERITLHTRVDKSWEVHVSAEEGKLYFDDGWPAFVDENGLIEGDFLSVGYDAVSEKWTVQLFEGSGWENTGRYPNPDVRSMESADSNQLGLEGCSRGGQVTAKKFVRLIKLWHLTTHMDVPKTFAEYIGARSSTWVTLRNSSGREWTVEMRGRPNNFGFRYYLVAAGWSNFVTQNFIREGMVVLFTLELSSSHPLVRVDVLSPAEGKEMLDSPDREGLLP